MLVKKATVFFCFFLAFTAISMRGQNLVPNPSFEDYINLKCLYTTDTTDFNKILNHWYLPTFGSADVLSTLVSPYCVMHCQSIANSAEGHQDPRTGNIMAGLILYSDYWNYEYKEYLSVKLTEPLTKGNTYYAEMYVSLADNSLVANNNIGMNFTVKRDTNYLNYFVTTLERQPLINEVNVIVDTLNWVKVSGMFKADSAYEFLSIGNFFSAANTTLIDGGSVLPIDYSYYFIDDVSVNLVCGKAQRDTLICTADSITLDGGSNFVQWAVSSHPDSILSNQRWYTHFVRDSTTFLVYSPCDTQEITVAVAPQNMVDLGPDKIICGNQSVALKAKYPGAICTWNTGETDSVIHVRNPGIYWVEVEWKGCTQYDSIQLTRATINLGKDTLLCEDETLYLNAFYPNGSYLWGDGSTQSFLEISNPGKYWVQMTVGECTLFDSILVQFENCATILQMPNVFTPNNDGVNDALTPQNENNIFNAHFTVFNRWGSIVHETVNEPIFWDGWFNNAPCAAGQYFWVVKYADAQGNSKILNGSTALLR